MIRFIPDTLRDALWRPLAMGAPNGGVYVEIMAPDLRFACLLLLTLAAVVLGVRRGFRMTPVAMLVLLIWLSFIPWLATTGNGRYFIAVLLLAGPACIGLIDRLPMTLGFRLTAAAIVVALQGFALAQNSPWGLWGLTEWGKPYFEIALTDEERRQPATYVTISSISYSLVAPQFDERSHWINLASLAGDPDQFVDDRRAQAFLDRSAASGLPLKLLVPTMPAYMDGALQPNTAMRAEINRILAEHQLALAPGDDCKVVQSRGVAVLALHHLENVEPKKVAQFGFWICRLKYPVARPPQAAPSAASRAADRVFEKLELSCPRIFRHGDSSSVRIADGFSRNYPSSDTKAYVLDDGQVLYKYWRGLNPGHLGTVDKVLSDSFVMNCNAIRGRSGLPWEREL